MHVCSRGGSSSVGRGRERVDDLSVSDVTEPGSPVLGALANLRDVAASSADLNRGVLLRSDAPLRGDRSPLETWWPPATVIDLRDHAEKRELHPLSGHAVVLDLPLFNRTRAVAASARRWPDRLSETYIQMLSDPLASRLVGAVAAIADAEPPVLVHCAAGKDRTGVTVAVILRLVGVAPERIIADYALTGPAMPDVLARMRSTVRAMTEGAALAVVPPYVHAAAPDDMAEFLSALDGHDGGAAGWFTANGGDVATVERLRSMLLR